MKTLHIPAIQEGQTKRLHVKEPTLVKVFQSRNADPVPHILKAHDTLFLWWNQGQVCSVVRNEMPL